MAIAHDKQKYTVEDYLQLPDDERVELIDGELVMCPAPKWSHQQIVGKLYYKLVTWNNESKAGEVGLSPTDVILSRYDAVQPDLLFVARERTDIIGDRVRGAPDWAVEILSPGSEKRDLVVKKDLYAKHGVREYWIIDPEARAVTIHALENGMLNPIRTVGPGAVAESDVMTGFAVPVDELFP